ncbi:nucleotidyltransferase domain-containing protein [Herbiconiux moechotypicola]|uniref:HTH arsR-type domain-containing protein n=1 Tax=Herbiconiux moechotypicola TaxID=637393 RepID=A0ABN3DER6_9MICO|nr:nucleotidyltransferase domain-containing protein [Herbiconiux moechotypicola]MCS5729347.1 nucleotidyltransferase domain-containing protein [Herbiconiux moechotypicola]
MELQSPFRVVTAGVDGDVLGALAQADVEHTVAEVHARIGRSTEGVRRSLDRLASQGIVQRLRIGRSTAYRLNRDHLAAPAILELAELSATLIARITESMRGWAAPPVFAAIFGSTARRDMRTDSDIDLLMITDDPTSALWEGQVGDLAGAVERWTGNDVRPLVLSTSEATDAAAKVPVLREVLAEGIPVYGERAAFRRLIGA